MQDRRETPEVKESGGHTKGLGLDKASLPLDVTHGPALQQAAPKTIAGLHPCLRGLPKWHHGGVEVGQHARSKCGGQVMHTCARDIGLDRQGRGQTDGVEQQLAGKQWQRRCQLLVRCRQNAKWNGFPAGFCGKSMQWVAAV
jgi:hypothetical protein